MLIVRVHDNITEQIAEALASAPEKAARVVAIQAAKDTSPYVPMDTGSLNVRTRVSGNMIIYPGPYARYLYYGKVMVNSATGKGPMHFSDESGNEVIRFPKGAVLRATEKDLVFTKDAHPQAQAHWFEASKAQNMEKWERVAEKAVKELVKK